MYSSADETTAFENPVMGTSVPAPAYFAILSNTPIPVRIAARTIREIETSVPDVSALIPIYLKRLFRHSPIVQIVPPKRNAKVQFFIPGDAGDAFFVIISYSLSRDAKFITPCVIFFTLVTEICIGSVVFCVQ